MPEQSHVVLSPASNWTQVCPSVSVMGGPLVDIQASADLAGGGHRGQSTWGPALKGSLFCLGNNIPKGKGSLIPGGVCSGWL